eukprot:7026845-Alexandrium_andersonii.AAC.1
MVATETADITGNGMGEDLLGVDGILPRIDGDGIEQTGGSLPMANSSHPQTHANSLLMKDNPLPMMD